MTFPDFKNWRFNPFTQVFNGVAIADELHTIILDEETNAYGIRLFEGVQLDNPSSVVIVENVTGGAIFTEVPRTTAPSSGQFRVDYLAETFFGTSFIEFNAADDGTVVSVSYVGRGTNVKDRYTLLAALIIPVNLGVEGNVQITDNLDVGIDLDVVGNVDVGGAVTVIDDPTGATGIGNRDFNDNRYVDQINFQNDHDFSLGYWQLTDAVLVDDSATTSGSITTLSIDGANNGEAAFKPGNRDKFFPIQDPNKTLWHEIFIRRNVAFDGNVRLQIKLYDADKVFLSNRNHVIGTADLLTITYRAFSFRTILDTEPTAKFFDFRIEVAGATGGNAFITNIVNSFNPIGSTNGLNNFGTFIASPSIVIGYPDETLGFGGLTYIPAREPAIIALTDSTFVTYDIFGSDQYRRQAKMAIIQFQAANIIVTSLQRSEVQALDRNSQTWITKLEIQIFGSDFVNWEKSWIGIIPIFGHALNANNFSNVRMQKVGVTPLDFRFLGFLI